MDNIDCAKIRGIACLSSWNSARICGVCAWRSFFDAAFKKRFERRYVYLDV